MQQSSTSAATGATDRRRVILVAYHYPPDPAVGSLRARNVAQALAAAGHEVHVVSVARPETQADSQDGPVHVLRVIPSASVRDFLAGMKKLISRRKRQPAAVGAGDAADKAASANAWKSPERVSTLKRWLGAITWFPDDLQGFIMPASRAALELMRGDGRDVLYTTAPPFSDFIVGLLARRRRRFRWFLEFRDPWTDNIHKPWFVRSQLTDAIERWAERRCVAQSDGVVPVAAVFADVLARRYGASLTRKMLVVRNGIPSSAQPIPSDPSRFRIAYAGSFYIRRDPRPFFSALAAIRARGGVKRRLDVQLVGDCRYFEGEPLAPEIGRLGLADVVTFVNWLPHKESVELMCTADLLLLLAQDQPLSIPNKLYEYLGTGKPILAVVDQDGESARLLREVGGHYVIGENDPPDAMERALTQALAAPPSTSAEQSEVLKSLTTAAQMKILADWVAKVAATPR